MPHGMERATKAPRLATAGDWLPHLILVVGVVVVAFPVYMTFVASSLTPQDILAGMPPVPGTHLLGNYREALIGGVAASSGESVARMLWNSLLMALIIAVGKIAISLISAYAVVFFRFPFRMVFFWMIFVTLMLPIEVRIIPTYKVVADLGMIDSFAGLTIPVIASATATLLFRQFFLTIPDELVEAAKIDGAGPLRFLWDTVIPLSRTNMAALFVILFIFGWNQFLWPLIVTNSAEMTTIVIGLTRMIGTGDGRTDWDLVMATAILAMLPPALVVLLMQRWFVKGLVESEK
ncbi:MAG TPA: sn-glycerol-3-phosphate ABC transporter permease UgpE [Stellaceae bacterium]|nr:sn-glycerol-3-phosphate ABC transporter permease UgpE [Stellaceae bacterium]